MNGWAKLLLIFFLLLFFYIICILKGKENARQERKNLLEEKQQLLKRQQIKERLRFLLERRYKWRLNIGYTVLLTSFIAISALFGLLFPFQDGFQGYLSGVIITEGVLFIVTLYAIQKPCEFKHIITEFAPFLKNKVFGKDINIDAEIQEIKNKIVKIDERILVLDKIIAA